MAWAKVGTVVELLADGEAFEVEFSDSPQERLRHRNGRTYESLGLLPDQIMLLHFEPALPEQKSELVTV